MIKIVGILSHNKQRDIRYGGETLATAGLISRIKVLFTSCATAWWTPKLETAGEGSQARARSTGRQIIDEPREISTQILNSRS
jgi:hypothetical protein